jgi:hypothetical protein
MSGYGGGGAGVDVGGGGGIFFEVNGLLQYRFWPL